MRDYITLGPVPYEEECQQLGCDYNQVKAREEVRRYIEQLKVMFPIPDESYTLQFGVRSFNHEFGTYYEAVIYYDSDIESEVDFAINVEANTPAHYSPTPTLPQLTKTNKTSILKPYYPQI